MTRPDFSPRMLRFFLFARSIARDGFDKSAHGQLAARHDLANELMAATGLPWSAIRAAFAGQLRDGGARAAIWAALGHFPADHGIVFGAPGEAGKPDRASGVARPAGGAGGEAAGAPREAGVTA